ncbi:MAG: glycoside hydrolase family 92 protein [Ruminococcaceae bacterium]|nr:glycoside hydrolase family 92 protein [Oscillospiraceae bacterium]
MKQPTHFSSPETPWGKPHTTQLYLHPPFAENIVTLRPNTTILLGEIGGGAYPQHQTTGRHDESDLPSSAMVFLYRNQMPDYKKGEFSVRQDGIPIHSLRQNLGEISLEMECFCNTERVPTVFTKLTIQNNLDEELKDQIGMTARTAPEFDLLGANEPDGYYPIEPSINRWMHAPYWQQDEEKLTDGQYTIYYHVGENVRTVCHDRNRMHYLFTLAPGAKTELYFAFSRAHIDKNFSFEEEKKKTEAFWEGELSRIRVFPKKEDPKFYAMYRSLVAQGLQMFARPTGVNYVIMRQGGLQRLMWPTENRSLIRVLARIGDFDKYIDAIFKTYFHVMQAESGEVVNFGLPWGSVTGSALFAFGAVAMYNEALYEKYKENAYRAFRFIEEQREFCTQHPDLADGLYPPKQSSDFAAVGQVWAHTDLWNVHGYAMYAEGLKRRGDEARAKEVTEAFWDYRGRLQAIVDRAVQEQKDNERIILPADARFIPEIEEKVASGLFSRRSNDLKVLNLGLLGEESPIAKRILKMHFETDNGYENGMCLTYAPSFLAPRKGRRWYGTWMDSDVHYYYRRNGMDEKAKEILDAQLKYMMSKEYYMGERIDDVDAWFFPWSPNCSANARTITMLCDWYIGPEEFTFYEKENSDESK